VLLQVDASDESKPGVALEAGLLPLKWPPSVNDSHCVTPGLFRSRLVERQKPGKEDHAGLRCAVKRLLDQRWQSPPTSTIEPPGFATIPP
jgi:hypothetical protein